MIARSPMIEASIATLHTSLENLGSLPRELSRTQIANLGVVNSDVAQASAVFQHVTGLEPVTAAAAAAATSVAKLARSAADPGVDPTGLMATARYSVARTIAAAEATLVASEHAARGDEITHVLETARQASSVSAEHGNLLAAQRAKELLDEVAPGVRDVLDGSADEQAFSARVGELEHVVRGIRAGLGDTPAPWTATALDAAERGASSANVDARVIRLAPDAVLAEQSLVPNPTKQRGALERATEQPLERLRSALDGAVSALDLDVARHQAIADARTAFDELVTSAN